MKLFLDGRAIAFLSGMGDPFYREMSDGETPTVCDRFFVGNGRSLFLDERVIAFLWGDERW